MLRYLVNKPNNRAIIILTIYAPILILTFNILILKNILIGVIFTAVYFAIGAESLSNALNRKFFREPVSFKISSLILLIFSLVALLSPLMITESIRPMHVAILLLFSGLPLFLVKTRFAAAVQAQESVSSRSPVGIVIKWVVLAFISLLVSDIVWLAQGNITGYGLISDVIPAAHFYIVFAATGILIFLIFSSLSTSIKVALVLIHSLVLHLTWSLIAPTPVGVDPWSLIGDVNASIFGSNRFNAGSYPHPLVDVASFKIPDWLLLRIGVSIPYTISLLFQQLTQIDMIKLSPWIGPIIYAVLGRGILFQMGRTISLNQNYPFFLMIGGSFYPLFMVFGNETLKLTLAMPFFLFAIFLWIKYLVTKEKWYLYSGITLTAFHILSYSLFFITLIQIMVMVILLTRFREKSAKSNSTFFLPVILIASIMLIMLVPAADLLFRTNIMFPGDVPSSFQHFMLILSGSEGPVKDYRASFTNDFGIPFMGNSWWTIVNLFVWGLTLLGIVRTTFIDKSVHRLLLWLLIVTHAAFFFSEFALSGQRPLGAHMGQIAEIARLPFFAAGLTLAITSFAKNRLSIFPREMFRNLAIPGLIIIILIASISVTAANAVEIQTYWLGKTDVDAAKYIVDKANANDIRFWTSSIAGSGTSFLEPSGVKGKDITTIKATFYSQEGSVNTLAYEPPALDLMHRNKLQLWIKVEKQSQGGSIPIYISLTDRVNKTITYAFDYGFGQWTNVVLSYSDLSGGSSGINLRDLDRISLSFRNTYSGPAVVWLGIENPSGGFVLLTQDLSTWPIYGLTNGKTLMGGFNDEPSLGTSPVTRTSTLYWDLRTAPSLAKLKAISEESGVCTIFLQIPSYSLPDNRLLQNFMDGPKEFISHDSHGTYKTSVYQKQMC